MLNYNSHDQTQGSGWSRVWIVTLNRYKIIQGKKVGSHGSICCIKLSNINRECYLCTRKEVGQPYVFHHEEDNRL